MSAPDVESYPPEPVSYRLADGRLISDMHEDDVRDSVETFRAYEHLGDEEAMAHALATFRACRERRMIQARAEARRLSIASSVVPR